MSKIPFANETRITTDLPLRVDENGYAIPHPEVVGSFKHVYQLIEDLTAATEELAILVKHLSNRIPKV